MEEYLKLLLEQIRCQKAKTVIEKEMRNHIEDEAAALAAEGLEEAQALEAAVKEMGDPVEVGISLDAIHRPKPAWKMIGLLAILSIVSFMVHCVIGLDNGELGMRYIFTRAVERIVGIGIMLLVYHLDYSILAKFAKPAALVFLGGACLFSLFGNTVNGSAKFFSIHGASLSMLFYMMLYIPIFAALLYQYHGSGLSGIMKSLIWLLMPCLLVYRIPNLMAAVQLFFVMGVMLTIAVWKNWFHVNRRAFTAVFWSAVFVLPSIALALALKFHWLAEYQEVRALQFLTGKESEFAYIGNNIQKILDSSFFWGGAHVNMADLLPAYNQDYILVFLASYYGILVLIAIVAVLIYTVWKMFFVTMRQKNQLGMMMGGGCALFFASVILINILEICGRLPITATWLPFFSSGLSCTIVSYVMAGIILSIYRYKDVLPAMPKRGGFLTIKNS